MKEAFLEGKACKQNEEFLKLMLSEDHCSIYEYFSMAEKLD